MTELGDVLQLYAAGLTRPEPGQEDWGIYVAANGVDFAYAPVSGTTSNRPVGVPDGWVYYDTTISGFVGWNGATWTNIGSGAAATQSTGAVTAITFGSDQRVTWNGSGACSLTYSATGAVDGKTVTIFFPANQITSLAVSTALSPAAAFAVANFVPTAPYLLVMTYLGSGPTVVLTGHVVTDN